MSGERNSVKKTTLTLQYTTNTFACLVVSGTINHFDMSFFGVYYTQDQIWAMILRDHYVLRQSPAD